MPLSLYLKFYIFLLLCIFLLTAAQDVTLRVQNKDSIPFGSNIQFSVSGSVVDDCFNSGMFTCYDWIAVYVNNTCLPDTSFNCYLHYISVKDLSNTKGEGSFSTFANGIQVGLYDIRYYQKRGIFGQNTFRTFVNNVNVTFATGYSIVLSDTLAQPGDLFTIYYNATNPTRGENEWIGLFKENDCLVDNACGLSYQRIAKQQTTGSVTFSIPTNSDNTILEFRFLYLQSVKMYQAGFLLVKSNKDVSKISGSLSRNETLVSKIPQKIYEYDVKTLPNTKAMVTLSARKLQCADTVGNLVMTVKYGQMPTTDFYDFRDSQSDAVTSIVQITTPQQLGKYYVVINTDRPIVDPSLCTFQFNAVYFIRCPQDCNAHGDCNNGTCICAPGYKGDSCNKGTSNYNPPRVPLRPMLFIPGIGGSVLEFSVKNSKTIISSWLNIDNLMNGLGRQSRNKAFCETMMGLYNAESQLVEPEFMEGVMNVITDNGGLKGISCLLSNSSQWWVEALHLKSFLADAYYFADFISYFEEMGYIQGKTLFGFPYDWRQSNMAPQKLELLRSFIKQIYTTNGNRKLDVFSHSMGGLLFRSYISKYADEASQYINTWTTGGTPFRGSTLASKGFISGNNFGNPMVLLSDSRAFAIDTPSVYELLPDQIAPYSRVPQIYINITGGLETNFSQNNLKELYSWVTLGYSYIGLDDKKYDRPFRYDIFEYMLQNRRIWDQVKLPPGIRFYNIHGDTVPTEYDFYFTQPVTNYTEVFGATADHIGYVAGDGTVPLESAMGDGFDAQMRIAIPDTDHMGLARSPNVLKWLRYITGTECPFFGSYFVKEHDQVVKAKQLGENIDVTAYYNLQLVNLKGKYRGGVASGYLEQSSIQFSFNMSVDCLSIHAKFFYIGDQNQTVIMEEFDGTRVIGPDCFPKTSEPCDVPFGKGIQRCYYGWVYPFCEMTSCNPGYCAAKDPFNNIDICVPCGSRNSKEDSEMCPHTTPYRCHNNDCVASLNDCKQLIESSHEEVLIHKHLHQKPLLQLNNFISDSILEQKMEAKNTIEKAACPPERPFTCSKYVGHCFASNDVCSAQMMTSDHFEETVAIHQPWYYYYISEEILKQNDLQVIVKGHVSIHISQGTHLPFSLFKGKDKELKTKLLQTSVSDSIHVISLCRENMKEYLENGLFIGVKAKKRRVSLDDIDIGKRIEQIAAKQDVSISFEKFTIQLQQGRQFCKAKHHWQTTLLQLQEWTQN